MRTYWKKIVFIISLLFFLGIQVHAQKFEPGEYRQLEFDKELNWSEPEIHSFSLENGISFFLVKDNELPLVDVRVLVRSGEFLVPNAKQGLAEITAEVMRSGGTEKYPSRTLNHLLADKAAKMSMSFDFTSGTASLNVLTKDFEELLPVFVNVLHEPEFPAEKIELARKKLMTDIARRNDQQSKIAFREFRKLIYGQDYIYAQVPEFSTVKGITREDLQEFHKNAYQGSNMFVGISGDIEPEKIKSLLKKEFSVFSRGDRQKIDVPEVDYKYARSLHLVDKPDVNQSYILMGHIGGRRQNPDYASLQVMNKILSGGFSGRLFENVRTKEGLAYSVFGNYGCNYFYPGMFFVGLQTKTSSTAKAIKKVEKELSRLQQGVSAKELKQAKEQFLNSLVFRYEKPSDFLFRRMIYTYRGMPKDSFEKLVQEIREVSVQDIDRVAKEYLHPDKLKTLVVGQKQELKKELEESGKVREIDLSSTDNFVTSQ